MLEDTIDTTSIDRNSAIRLISGGALPHVVTDMTSTAPPPTCCEWSREEDTLLVALVNTTLNTVGSDIVSAPLVTPSHLRVWTRPLTTATLHEG